MKHFHCIKILIVLMVLLSVVDANAQKPPVPAIVIHGGAGVIERGKLTPEVENEIRVTLQRALDTGYAVLEVGGSATDAVIAAIQVLEDSPRFNAGKGAVMNLAGTHELDASIMNGADLNAGAVAGVTTIKNPILAAQKVMTESPHVLLTGNGAEQFAREQKLSMVENTYFTTDAVYDSWERYVKSKSGDPRGDNTPGVDKVSKYGTVGAVAIDASGNIAAGTSTGGMMGKEYNRIGDSPIIGAGTYADNSTCGISCTGHGEYFIRVGVAKEISDQMAFGNKALPDATQYTLDRIAQLGGSGGLIAIDKEGNIRMDFNTKGMYRGYKHVKETKIAIYADE